MSWKIKAKFPIFVRFSIFVNFATLRGVPLVISFKLSPTLGNFLERFTLWPCPPNSSISLLLSKALANFSHFRQICHLLQNRRCDFSPSSPLFWGGGLFASSLDLQVRLWRFFAILVNIIIFVKITIFKGPLLPSH